MTSKLVPVLLGVLFLGAAITVSFASGNGDDEENFENYKRAPLPMMKREEDGEVFDGGLQGGLEEDKRAPLPMMRKRDGLPMMKRSAGGDDSSYPPMFYRHWLDSNIPFPFKKAPLPMMKKAPLPMMKKSPLPMMKKSPLPMMKKSPLPMMKKSPLPMMKKSPLPMMKKSPEAPENNESQQFRSPFYQWHVQAPGVRWDRLDSRFGMGKRGENDVEDYFNGRPEVQQQHPVGSKRKPSRLPVKCYWSPVSCF